MVEAALKEFEAMLSNERDESGCLVDIKESLLGAYKINTLAQNCVSGDVKFHEIINDIYCGGGNPEIPGVFFKALARYYYNDVDREKLSAEEWKRRTNEIWCKDIGVAYPHLYGLVKKCMK